MEGSHMKDPRVDAYIAKSQPFARPILKHLRALVHKGNPDVQETIKWGFPSFEYKGPFCSMASFKQHAVFGFWKFQLLKDPRKYLTSPSNRGGEAMGNLGRITSLDDLPADSILLHFIKQARKLNDEGVKLPPRPRRAKKDLAIPDYFVAELKKNREVLEAFNAFSYSHRKEYLEWITEARTETTRLKRLTTAIQWIGEGKSRNWKYERKG